MDETTTKSDLELEALAETGDVIKVGNREYTIYPIVLGKLKLVSKKLSSFAPLIGFLDANISGLKKSDEKFAELITTSIDDVVEAFFVLTHPNEEKALKEWHLTFARLKKEDNGYLEWHLDIPKIIEILITLKKQALIEGLLKNVSPLKEKMKNLVGQDSSPQSSASQNGESVI